MLPRTERSPSSASTPPLTGSRARIRSLAPVATSSPTSRRRGVPRRIAAAPTRSCGSLRAVSRGLPTGSGSARRGDRPFSVSTGLRRRRSARARCRPCPNAVSCGIRGGRECHGRGLHAWRRPRPSEPLGAGCGGAAARVTTDGAAGSDTAHGAAERSARGIGDSMSRGCAALAPSACRRLRARDRRDRESGDCKRGCNVSAHDPPLSLLGSRYFQ